MHNDFEYEHECEDDYDEYGELFKFGKISISKQRLFIEKLLDEWFD